MNSECQIVTVNDIMETINIHIKSTFNTLITQYHEK